MELENKSVSLRVGVGKFIYGHGCIKQLADEVERLGGKPLIVGGPTTIPLVLSLISSDFKAKGIDPVIYTLTGACSKNNANLLKAMTKEHGCTVILGVGGGKCMDLAKCAATFANMDLINVPTSVATCAASSAVCIMYTDAGVPDGSVQMGKEVDVVIADTDVIATAPKRTLAAGIFDSIAKLPEVLHNRTVNSYHDCILEKYICVVNSQAIYDFLIEEGPKVFDLGLESGRFTDVILTNLLHTSVVSGFSLGVDQLALAHGFYDFMRRSFTREAAHVLHGELVALGVLMQLKFNQMNSRYIDEVRNTMRHMGLPTTLPEACFDPTEANIQLLVDYLIPATALTAEDEPRLREAIALIC